MLNPLWLRMGWCFVGQNCLMGAFNWIKHSSYPPFFFSFFFLWMDSPVVPECLLILSGINIWDDCKQQGANLLPSCRNRCCYISKSVVSMQIRTQGRPWCPFAGWFCHLTPTSCREPRSQIKSTVLRRLLGFRDSSMPVLIMNKSDLSARLVMFPASTLSRL